MPDVINTKGVWKINVVKLESRNTAISKSDIEMNKQPNAVKKSATPRIASLTVAFCCPYG